MPERRTPNPKVLLIVAGVVLFVSSAIAIYVAAGCSPESGSRDRPGSTATSTLRPN